VATTQPDAWHDDHLQFARLLAELMMVITPEELHTLVGDSMNLSVQDIKGLTERANIAWEQYLAALQPNLPKVTRLTFEIITTNVWDDHGVNAIQEEFEGIYGGNLNIDSACLTRVETIVAPEHLQIGDEDEDDDHE
jgi:hypothetical protein